MLLQENLRFNFSGPYLSYYSTNLCFFGSIAENGKTFYYRTCEPNASNKIDTCENRELTLKAGGTKNARTCYCDGNLCNGTSQINSGLYVLGSLMFFVLLVQKIYH